MKIIFRIHYSFIILVMLLILMGYINYVICFMIILMIHECGHILMIKILKYDIEEIHIYGTGGVIKTNIDINIPSSKYFLISIGGIFMQLMLFFLPLHNKVFITINISLIIFNLLPIYPLDGYNIFLSLTEYFLPYRYIIKISYLISLIFLFIFFKSTLNILIFIFLYLLNIKYILMHHYYMEKFFLERYLYGIKYHHPKIVKDIRNIYKCRKNYLKYDNILVSEEKYYAKRYSNY